MRLVICITNPLVMKSKIMPQLSFINKRWIYFVFCATKIITCRVLPYSHFSLIHKDINGVCTAYIEVFIDLSCKSRAHVCTNTLRNMTSSLAPISVYFWGWYGAVFNNVQNLVMNHSEKKQFEFEIVVCSHGKQVILIFSLWYV